MVDAMKVKRSIYFATLQGYVIFETKLYLYIKFKILINIFMCSDPNYLSLQYVSDLVYHGFICFKTHC